LKCDVLIIGGGIVGAATALALAQKTTLQIALIDAQALSCSWQAEQSDYRVSAISRASQNFFQGLQVWNKIQAKRISPYTKMHVWDAGGEGEIHFDCAEIDASVLGYIIEDSVIRSSLLEKLSDYNNVTLLSSLKLVSMHDEEGVTKVVIEDGRVLQAQLVIGADGGNSWVRSQVGIELKSKDYQHTAIVTTARTTLPHQFTAWQRFLPAGPLAFLPLMDEHLCSIVWSLPPSQADELLALEPAAFSDALGAAFAHQLGEITTIGERYSFPLQMRHVKNYVQSRLALVGDAAHTIHPLAGQGVNLGLLDAACLVNIIVEAISKERDFSSLSTLRRYERARKSDNAVMLTVVDALKCLFASEVAMIKSVRNKGLEIMNQMRFIKQYLINYAVGKR
jgi:2-octaprenylphenol hydroxylase